MRLVRYNHKDEVRTGVLVGHDIHATPGQGPVAALEEVTLLAPCDPRVIVCAGRNYGVPGKLRKPRLFLKAANAVTGPGAEVRRPHGLRRLEYEGELAVVIGRTAHQVPKRHFRDYILGYTCANDITADDWRNDGQWVRAKSADTFCPLGPWIETDIDDPAKLHIRTRVNGLVVQDSPTAAMLFGVDELLAYVTRWITLNPGDVLLTGSPDGVGPLAVGDEVAVDIAGVGVLSNTVR
ncbi:fumarylacetoacetate hydrolase family protein [Nonomuraea endophytica]|uniref:fumarylacetoacetate hydrolase family protein n=1 Tax=Nonomuraea endophytica TaxID=714136 RepID=UPI0037CAA578